jgi:glycosyltransferase involved in cell wall biosynthesis
MPDNMELKSNQPFLSIVIPVWNGEMFLEQAIQSLLAQDYQNIELIILDNLSSDHTPDICKIFTQKDSRVKYILDDIKRDFVQAEKKVSEFASGELIMVASDDDWYEPKYISTLIDRIVTNPKIGLAYSGWGWILPDGSKKMIKKIQHINSYKSKLHNFIYYLFFRTPIPLVFGIVRTEFHKDALNYLNRPDHRGWNHDNLYLLRILSITCVESTNDTLFFYRQRDRVELYKKRGTSYTPEGIVVRYLNSLMHQKSVMKAVERIIDDSPFTIVGKFILKLCNFFALIYYCSFVLTGIKGLIIRILKHFVVFTGLYNFAYRKFYNYPLSLKNENKI